MPMLLLSWFFFFIFYFHFFVFWPTLQLETDDNKKLYYTQAHPFDLMAVECAAFNASPGMGTRACWVGFSWVGLVGSLELGGDGHIMVGARSVWAMWSVPVVTMLRSTFFAFGGQESC